MKPQQTLKTRTRMNNKYIVNIKKSVKIFQIYNYFRFKISTLFESKLERAFEEYEQIIKQA